MQGWPGVRPRRAATVRSMAGVPVASEASALRRVFPTAQRWKEHTAMGSCPWVRLRHTWVVMPLFTVLSLLLVSCSLQGSEPDGRGVPEFAVVSGADGIAVTNGQWIERVPGLSASRLSAGPEAVGLDATSAAVVASEAVAVVRPHEPAVRVACADCAGIAATNEFVVTTRKNFTPGEGFDIVLFTHDLTPSRTVPAQRLEERGSTDVPAENTESPITLAADADRVTVGYLSRLGSARRGPSILAQYDYDGRLLDSVFVDGLIGRSAVSPNGRYLALGVDGSGGACITVSEPAVIDLESLNVRMIDPAIPSGVTVDSASLSDPWFMLTDLAWQEGTLLATGEVHNPAPGETCDPEPQMWQRSFDPATGRLNDYGDLAARAIRWIGPDCEHLLAVTRQWEGAGLVRTTYGPEQRLGSYDRINLGRSMPPECRATS